MARLPEHVILVWTEGDWNVAAFPGDHPNLAAEVVTESEGRKAQGATVHVWRVPLAGAAEIDAQPQRTQVIPPALADL